MDGMGETRAAHREESPAGLGAREEVKAMKRPFDRLVRRAEDMGYRQIMDLGALCGLNRTSISSRVNGKTEWRRHDIEVLCQALEIPQEEIGPYFYPQIGSPKK